MDLIKILNSIDFIDGRVDLLSVHPNNLFKLVDAGYIDRIDPGDGELIFYVLTRKGAETWANQVLDENLESIRKLNEKIFQNFLSGKTTYYKFNEN